MHQIECARNGVWLFSITIRQQPLVLRCYLIVRARLHQPFEVLRVFPADILPSRPNVMHTWIQTILAHDAGR